MKIEILESAKGNEQKQNKLAKPPNPKSPMPRQAHMPRKDKARKKKATLRLGYIPDKNRKQPSAFIIIYGYRQWMGLLQKGGGGGGISPIPNRGDWVIQIEPIYYT